MTFEEKNLTGALFLNKNRNSENAPNMRGYVIVQGKKFWVSGWTKHKRADGEKWLSLALTPDDEGSSYRPRTDGVCGGEDVGF